MQLFNIDSESDILSKIKIIVRIRPTLSGEEKKEFIQMIDVKLSLPKKYDRKNYLEKHSKCFKTWE